MCLNQRATLDHGAAIVMVWPSLATDRTIAALSEQHAQLMNQFSSDVVAGFHDVDLNLDAH